MIPQSKGRGGAEKGRKKSRGDRVTGAQEHDRVTDDVIEEIDPADLFDPEEFGIRRNADTRRHA